MATPTNLSTHSRVTRLVITIYIFTLSFTESGGANQELIRGFSVTPNTSVSQFQPVLSDRTGNFSLGFLRVNRVQLALVVVHIPSFQPLWKAMTTPLARWSDSVRLIFDGSLVIRDNTGGSYVSWSTSTDGDRVVLLNTSNLQVQKKVGNSYTVVWQSFDFPTDTLVETQNFTARMKLVSSNGLYSMRLGSDFMGLYATFKPKTEQIYWKHKALEAKAEIVEGKGPIYARVNPDGYLGMYQNGTSPPVDMQAFNTFQRPIDTLVIVRLESDGNLNGYYWDGSNWVLDYQAILTQCELPSACGSFGICKPGKGCSCFNNQTDFGYDKCVSKQDGDFCNAVSPQSSFTVLRRKGVELPYKALMRHEMASSLERCERRCETSCTCWGSVYNNGSGFCYLVDYPIQTLLASDDDTKMGYFKMKEAKEKKASARLAVAFGVIGGAALIAVGVLVFWRCKIWRKKKRGAKGTSEAEKGLEPGPYKNLGSDSFRSVEMGNNDK